MQKNDLEIFRGTPHELETSVCYNKKSNGNLMENTHSR